jgi:flagellin
MAMQINTNLGALNVQGTLSKTSMSLSTSMERLSSGLRVNSAKDDAAGLAIGSKMTSQIRGMTVATRNANDGISMAQNAESAMGNITDTMQRMRDLAVQSANRAAVSTADAEKLNTEFKQLKSEIVRIISNTEFNGKKILAGSMSGANFQIGANTATDNQISITIGNMSTLAGGIGSMLDPTKSIGSMATSTNVRSAIDLIDKAISKVNNFRATLGAVQNRFATTIANLNSSIENQSAARSRIMDTDFASETASLSRSQILQQAGTAMLAQANQSGQGVLSLLR